MTEGRRNSVEIPLSKTLVALKRVRSLRDPSTNSMSNYTVAVDNMRWDSNPYRGTCSDSTNYDKHHSSKSKNHHLEGCFEEDCGSNSDSDGSVGMPNPRVNAYKKASKIRSKGTNRRRNLVRKPDQPRTQKALQPTSTSMELPEEDVDSYNESRFDLAERINGTIAKKRAGRRKPTDAVEDASMSRVGSPYISMSEARSIASSRSTFGVAAEEVDVVDSNYNGCGISYCWSRTPRYRESNLSPDAEGEAHPLLPTERRETGYRDVSPYPESSRSLSQKFRPRSFSELVGLTVVAKSLAYAISKAKIAPVYLFHGPRGTGKTSVARIFAAALNCLSLEEHRPCGFCRECVFLFSGRSRDVKELDAAKINRKDRVKALLKSASLAPFSSHFKVFIIDECQFLWGETWAAIFNGVEKLSRYSVFIMVTSDPEKLQHSSLLQCQRYHFPKIKDADVSCRLQKICLEERLEFDKDALDFIAAKSNGSLRDAETMLDQLSLLGKRITLSLAYELIGVVSDEELLDLLDLALSADTTNTVIRARELMKSRVDPMQLISQLANLIMDILSGRCQSGFSDAGTKFLRRHAFTEVGMQKLRHALKVLSESEKQLRTSKNQATWLTVALLQFSTKESMDLNGCSRLPYLGDEGVLSSTSPRDNLKNYVCGECNHDKDCSGRHCNRTKLDTIWRRTIGHCQSKSLKIFLQKEGILSDISVKEGVAIAEIEFCHPDHITRAEKTWKLIATSLQQVLKCDIQIRLKLVPTYIRRNAKVKRPSFSLLSCSGRKQQMSEATMTDENESDNHPEKERYVEVHNAQQLDAELMQEVHYFHDKEAIIIRNIEEDAQCTRMTSARCVQNGQLKECKLERSSSRYVDEEVQYVSIHEDESQPSCFAKTLKLRKRFLSSDAAQAACLRIQPHKKQDLSIPKKAVSELSHCIYPSTICSQSDAHVTYSSGEENVLSKDSKFSSKLLCWRVHNVQVLH